MKGICGCSSSGRAPPCQGGGSEFEPRQPLQSVHLRKQVDFCFSLVAEIAKWAPIFGGKSPHPAAEQEGRHQGFYPLNSHFLLFVSLAQIRDRRPLRKRGTAEDFYYRRGAQCAPISLPLRSAGFRTATHMVQSMQARHIRVAQLAGLVATVGTCGFDNWYNLSRRGATGRPAPRFTAA